MCHELPAKLKDKTPLISISILIRLCIHVTGIKRANSKLHEQNQLFCNNQTVKFT